MLLAFNLNLYYMADKITSLWDQYALFPGSKLDKVQVADLLEAAFGHPAKPLASKLRDEAYTDSAIYEFTPEQVIDMCEKIIPK